MTVATMLEHPLVEVMMPPEVQEEFKRGIKGHKKAFKNAKPHDLARLIPPMSPEQYERLRADIETKGQQEPVVMHERKILDGVHRHKACISLGIPCWSVEYEGTDPRSFVISANVHRRHLGAADLAGLITELRGEGKSLRAIADDTGVSKSTVARIVDETSPVPNGTPADETPEPATILGDEHGQPLEPEQPKVKGKDGKTYAAKRTVKVEPEPLSSDEYLDPPEPTKTTKVDPISWTWANPDDTHDYRNVILDTCGQGDGATVEQIRDALGTEYVPDGVEDSDAWLAAVLKGASTTGSIGYNGVPLHKQGSVARGDVTYRYMDSLPSCRVRDLQYRATSRILEDTQELWTLVQEWIESLTGVKVTMRRPKLTQ